MITKTDHIETETTEDLSHGERKAFVIGDFHGHVNRFEELLLQEGLLVVDPDGPFGFRRAREDEVEIICLGDVGHFGHGGSPTGDKLSYRIADEFADLLLWGNHDRAVFEPWHAFSGFQMPEPEVVEHMMALTKAGRLQLAAARHGFLLTHAGLHASFKYNDVSEDLKTDPEAFAEWINVISDPDAEVPDSNRHATRDAISQRRGGRSKAGGILWRDYEEKLFGGFPQVFGHSASSKHKVRHSNTGTGTCIDIGGKGDRPGDECLAGMYLPDRKVVRVDL